MANTSEPPLPVRIVPSAANVWERLARVASKFIVTVGGLILAIVIVPFTPSVQWALREFSYVAPNCEDPQGLSKLDIAELVSQGDAKVATSSVVSSPSEHERWSPMDAFDGRPRTGWVPATNSKVEYPNGENPEIVNGSQVDKPQLTIEFVEPQRIRMLCVINGVGNNIVAYTRADRIRTAGVRLTGSSKTGHDYSFGLRSMPEHEEQNRQTILLRKLEFIAPLSLVSRRFSFRATELTFTIENRYLGTTVEELACSDDDCTRYATGNVMLSELEVYVDA